MGFLLSGYRRDLSLASLYVSAMLDSRFTVKLRVSTKILTLTRWIVVVQGE